MIYRKRGSCHGNLTRDLLHAGKASYQDEAVDGAPRLTVHALNKDE